MKFKQTFAAAFLLGFLGITCDFYAHGRNINNPPPTASSPMPYALQCTCWNSDNDDWQTVTFQLYGPGGSPGPWSGSTPADCASMVDSYNNFMNSDVAASLRSSNKDSIKSNFADDCTGTYLFP